MAANIKIDTQVTPSLHPHNIDAIEGLDESTAPYVQETKTAFSEAYEGIAEVHNAREKAKKNQAWTESNQLLMVALFAEKKLERISRHFDTARANLVKSVDALEQSLSAPLQQQASAGNIPSEIRAHVKNLSSEQRMSFINDAIKKKDLQTLGCVLGGPGYLSGLGDEMVKAFTRTLNEMRAPEAVKRLAISREALRLIDQRAHLVHGEMERALGGTWKKVHALRQTNDEAEKALIMRDNDPTK